MAEIIAALLGGSALSAIISGLFGLAQTKRRRKDGVAAGVQALMYDRIKYLCKSHLARGQIASNDLEDLIRMHQIYHDDLNGNGYLDELMDAVEELPIVPAMPAENRKG